MAISENPLLKNIRGAINKQIVVKQYSTRTVVAKFPDMSRVVLSPLQEKRNEEFAKAVRYAQTILNDTEKYNAYKKELPPGQRVYHYAIKKYLASIKDGKLKPANSKDGRISHVLIKANHPFHKPPNTEDGRISRVFNTEDG